MARSRRGIDYTSLIFLVLLGITLIFIIQRIFSAKEGFQDPDPASAPALSHADATTPIKVFIYADKLKPTAKALLQSLKRHKYSYEVLGLGKPWEGWTGRTKTYLAALKDYKAAQGPDAVALFLDGYDVICIEDSDAFYAKYLNKPREMSVIFGAERSCNTAMCNRGILDWYDYHDALGGKTAVMAQTNPWGTNGEHIWSQTPIFTNNGTIMGPVADLEFLFEEILKTGIPDDQLAAGKVIIANFDRFDIDFEESLFRNKFRELDKLPDENGKDGPGFLHFHAMKTDAQQAEVLRRFQAY